MPRIAALSVVVLAAAGLFACASPGGPPANTAKAPGACLEHTGSRVERGEGECQPVAGRSIGAEEIQRTGAVGLDEALARTGAR